MLSSNASLGRGFALGVALGTAAAACGSLSNAGSFGSGGNGDGGFDGGAGFDSSPDSASTDGGAGEAAADAAPDAGLPPTTALFIQASPSLSSVRLCWSVNGIMPPTAPFPSGTAMPGSNYAGIPLGGVATTGSASSFAEASVQLYAIDAKNLAKIERGEQTPATCNQLICGAGQGLPATCLRYDLDYWPVGDPITVQSGGPSVVVLDGCLPGYTDAGTAPACGPTWTTAGNFHADVVHLDQAANGDAGLTVQPALLSPALSSLLGDGGVASVTYGPQDGADASLVGTLGVEGQTAIPTTVSLGTLADFGRLGFAVGVPGDDGGTHVALWMSLAQSQQLVDPAEDPSVFYGAPRTYLLAVLGDPGAASPAATSGDAGYDGTGLHLLLVPTPVAALSDE